MTVRAVMLACQLASAVPGPTIHACRRDRSRSRGGPCLREQLDALAGQQVSQFGTGLSGIRSDQKIPDCLFAPVGRGQRILPIYPEE